MSAAEARLFTPPKDKRLFVILGAFGTGKTEFSINLALALAKQGRDTAIADLDLVNPYFRSREKEELLLQAGIALIAPEGALRNADLPSIPPAFRPLLFDSDRAGVLDVGGDRTGARVLGSFTKEITAQQPEVWYVYNHARYDNKDTQTALVSLRQVEAQSGLNVTGLVNNTHLLSHTTLETLITGAENAAKLAELAGLPLICHCAEESLARENPGLDPLFPMKLHMNRPWEE